MTSTIRCLLVTAAATAAVVVLWAGPSLPHVGLLELVAAATPAFGAVWLAVRSAHRRAVEAGGRQNLVDDLTGVASRRGLWAHLDACLAGGLEDDGDDAGLALILLNLSGFKEINDWYGQGTGDALLQQVAQQLESCLATSGRPHLVGRLGGDEFAVVAKVVDVEDAFALGGALTAWLARPLEVDGMPLHVQTRFGVASAPHHGRTRSDLVFAADAAMLAAKTAGTPGEVYRPAIGGDRRRRWLFEDLYAALHDDASDQIDVLYQPIYTGGGRLAMVEALVRWQHPTLGRLSPDQFIPIAESHHLTLALTRRVLDVALTDLRAWRAAGRELRCAVNISAQDLSGAGLVDLVRDALERHEVPACALKLEITETAMMTDPAVAVTVFTALRELGVEIAVDDYGTGHSSLQYLLTLPAQVLKLDRVFVARALTDPRAMEITRSTLQLAHGLGLVLVAEGVEDHPTAIALSGLGCDYLQGFQLGRPQGAGDIARLAAEQPLGSLGAASSLVRAPVSAPSWAAAER